MKYQEQYCKKHELWYADFLEECPICFGEEMKPARKDPNETIRLPEKRN